MKEREVINIKINKEEKEKLELHTR